MSTNGTRPFRQALRDELLARGFETAIGNPNWAAFALELPDVHYETLRKAVTGERAPGVKLMERIAEYLGISPECFVEYELWLAQRQFDPREVGEEEALANLAAWKRAQARSRIRSN